MGMTTRRSMPPKNSAIESALREVAAPRMTPRVAMRHPLAPPPPVGLLRPWGCFARWPPRRDRIRRSLKRRSRDDEDAAAGSRRAASPVGPLRSLGDTAVAASRRSASPAGLLRPEGLLCWPWGCFARGAISLARSLAGAVAWSW